MVVEDDDDIRISLEQVLEFSDICAIAKCNGKEALEWLQNCGDHELPSLILLDLMMPEMDGYTFRYHQLKDPRLSQIPTIIVSAVGRGEIDRAMMYCSRYLPKPYNIDELLDAIHGTGSAVREIVKTKLERSPKK